MDESEIKILNAKLALRQLQIKSQARAGGWSQARLQFELDNDQGSDAIRSQLATLQPDRALERSLINACLDIARLEIKAAHGEISSEELNALMAEDPEICAMNEDLARLS